MERNISTNSSPEEKKRLSDMVYENLADYLFDKVVLVTLAYSDLGGGGTISTTDYGKSSRIIDTAKGKLMAPGKNSKIRCQFYLKNPSKLDGYILSPAVYDSQSLPASLTDMSIFRSYVGIKFKGGSIYSVSKRAGEGESSALIDFDMTMYDATYTDTFALEMVHNVSSTDIHINGTRLVSVPTDLVGISTDYTLETFYPFFAPARSTDGTSVNIVAENLQFIQER